MGRYIPNQHGAWAMLIVPFLFGTFAAKPSALHLLLFACWLLAYLFLFPLLQAIRTRKPARYRRPMLVFGIALVPLAALYLALRPETALYGLPMLPLIAVNVYYAKRNRERALLNDMAATLQFSCIIFVAYALGGGTDWTLAAELFAISVLYFIGTAFYVKTIIRERNNPLYYGLSVGYHGLILIGLGLTMPKLLLVPLSVLLIRAALQPRTRISVKLSGMLEIAYAAMMTGSVLAICI